MAGSNPDRGRTVSTVLGRRLGGELLRMREACDLRQSHAADALTASVAKVAKIERGLVPIRDPDIRALCHLYGETDADTVDRLLALAKADRERRKASGWWNQYPGLRSMAEYAALEDIATSVRTWQLAIVPGLLQTPDYARALAVGNGSWEDPDEIEPFIEARMTRQARLAGENPLELWAVVHEAALRQLVGGREVMREQLGHLVDMARQPNVKLQITPYLAGAHPGLTSAFTIVSFAEPGALEVVRMDTTSTALWLESDTDAERHVQLFDRISRLGLAQRSSVRLIDGILKEL
ncbi:MULTISPECIES: helix-turn-helix transcriptional regulator [unclassified Streptomyces]|uniref:helix-turn-helix domain-containing protein n=1 Tax=unclassified Streptomyces TaxID=2593676 RepID=UPI000493EC10|nr:MULTISPECIES: helix-turn-helix transcriptional regulator [unclassified Streptomyces]MCR8942494.1 helix-turn-helix domain-containing protein [Streptomyces sp. OUCMDZ-4982]MYR37225.1 helix-turn-helix domain-containing protein [Streptomyces sp. SID4944]SCD48726.1 Helix-turn-helix domain-containing protein [Streptomyces sp. DvalAA-19]